MLTLGDSPSTKMEGRRPTKYKIPFRSGRCVLSSGITLEYDVFPGILYRVFRVPKIKKCGVNYNPAAVFAKFRLIPKHFTGSSPP